MTTRRITLVTTAALLVALGASPAAAQDDGTAPAGPVAGDVQVKLLGTAVLPDGRITDVRTDLAGLPANTQTRANNNVVPTLAIEYFVTPRISLETICCLTQHDVDGTGGAAGAELVADSKILPATVTVKYHLATGIGLRPYVGVGPAYFVHIDEKPGAAARALGATRTTLSDELGIAAQAGLDLPLGSGRTSLSLDAKKYWVSTTARWFTATGVKAIETRHRLDPWVLSAGVAYRF